MGGSPAGHEPPTEHEPLTQEVEQALAGLPDAPLAEHPRVYETLDARIRRELGTGQEPDAGRAAEPPA